jgi:hypothetical protein
VLRSDRIWWALAAVLLLLSVFYAVRGFMSYSHVHPYEDGVGFMDVNRRWAEAHYVLRGKNPFDVAFAHSPPARKVAPERQFDTPRNSDVDADLGVPEGVVYPPWAYVTGILLLWPPYSVLAPYYACLMVAALAVVFVWAAGLGRPWGRATAAAFGAAALALASWGGAILLGNYPTIIVAFLVASLWLAERNRPILAGLFLALALTKFTIAGPFVLAFLVKRQFKTVAAAMGSLLIASSVTWFLTRTDPIEMVAQMMAASRQFIGAGYGPLQYLLRAGVGPSAASALVGVPVVALGLAGMLAARRCSLLVLFGIAGIVARLCSYHYYYDDNAMVFALMAFAVSAFRSGQLLPLAWFFILGLTLWAPARTSQIAAAQVFNQAVWIASAVILAVCGPGWETAEPPDSVPADRAAAVEQA